MVDLLAGRGAEDDALCAVCAGGESNKEAGNEIVFCERCDVAVHQKCYRVDIIPTGGPSAKYAAAHRNLSQLLQKSSQKGQMRQCQ